MADCNRCDLQCGHDACIQRIPVFQPLKAEQIAKITKLIRQREFQAKDILYHEGDPLSSLVIFRYGKMKLIRFDPEGNEILLDIMGVGDFYGGDSLFDQNRARETSVFLEPSGVCLIDARELKLLVKQEPDIGLRLLEYYCAYANQQRELLEIVGMKSAQKRLATFLLMQSSRIGSDILELTQQDIANSINLAQETVNRKLSEFKKKKLIAMDGYKKIKLINKASLREIN